MKNLFSLVLALLVCGTVFAQESISTVNIEDKSDENEVLVDQFTFGGLDSDVDIIDNSDGNAVSVVQAFIDNDSDVSITDGSDDNTVFVYQDDLSFFAGGNVSDVAIDESDDNYVLVDQQEDDNISDVKILDGSDENTVWVAQVTDGFGGFGNESSVKLDGSSDGNFINISQQSENNYSNVNVDDDSDDNTVAVGQNILTFGGENDSEVSIKDGSDDNSVTVFQERFAQISTVRIDDDSDGNTVLVDQTDSFDAGGSESIVRILDDSSDNMVDVAQDYLGLSTVVIKDDSNGNSVTVIQF